MTEKSKGVSPAGDPEPLSKDFIAVDALGISMKTLTDMSDIVDFYTRKGVRFYIYSSAANRMVPLRNHVQVRGLSIERGDSFTISVVGASMADNQAALADFEKNVYKKKIAKGILDLVRTEDHRIKKERHTTQIIRLTKFMEKSRGGNGTA